MRPSDALLQTESKSAELLLASGCAPQGRRDRSAGHMFRVTSQDVEHEKSIRRLREQFHGKSIPILEARTLMRRYNNDYALVTRAIIMARDHNIDGAHGDLQGFQNDQIVQGIADRLRVQRLRRQMGPAGPSAQQDREEASESSSEEEACEEEEHDAVSPGLVSEEEAGSQDGRDEEDSIVDDAAIQDIAVRLLRLPLTVQNLRMHEQARRREIPAVDCLFACETCKRSWWRRVPERKRVSRCQRCHSSYEAVPAIHLWGYAVFNCLNCNNSFRAYGQMGVGSLCFVCRSMVLPSEVFPPRQNEVRERPPVALFRAHSCYAEDCCNRKEPYIAGMHCVHPSTRRARGLPLQLHFSQRHEHTESTVPTCISQGDLMENEDDIIQRDLEQIPEEQEED